MSISPWIAESLYAPLSQTWPTSQGRKFSVARWCLPVWLTRVKTFSSLFHSLAGAQRAHSTWVVFFFILFKIVFLLQLSQFPPMALPRPTPIASTVSPHPIVHVHGSFIHVPWLDPSPSFPSYAPPRLLSVCSLFPCLRLCLACLCILFIKFFL